MQWSCAGLLFFVTAFLLIFLLADVRVSLREDGRLHKVTLQRKQLVERQTAPAQQDTSFVSHFRLKEQQDDVQVEGPRPPFPSHTSAPTAAEAQAQHYAGIGQQTSGCREPQIDWSRLQSFGCLARQEVCVDQNRFIVFDERLRPGASFQEDSAIFDHSGFHNIPGYQDNLRGTKTSYYALMSRSNSSADPPDIQSPSFQTCEVPLVWWPWWAFNPADVYLNSVLPLERLVRNRIIDDSGIRLVPVLDGFRLPRFYRWWFSPLFKQEVLPLAELSSRSRSGSRCFQHMLFCDPQGLWNLPEDGNWTEDLEPYAVGQKIVWHHLKPREQNQGQLQAPAVSGVSNSSLKVAIIERSRTRHIINLKDLLKRCNAMKLDGAFAAASEGGAAAGGGNRGAAKLGRTAAGAVTCVALSFDDVEDFEGMLTELQTVDVLVGMHGAGLVNAFFLRPGSAFVEIFPCRFASEWPSQYFWRTGRLERQLLAFQIRLRDERLCHPSNLEKDPAGVNYKEGAWFVQTTLARDQDITLDFAALEDVLNRIARLRRGPAADGSGSGGILNRAHAMHLNYFVVES